LKHSYYDLLRSAPSPVLATSPVLAASPMLVASIVMMILLLLPLRSHFC